MNKKTIIFIVGIFLILLLIGGGAFAYLQKQDVPSKQEQLSGIKTTSGEDWCQDIETQLLENFTQSNGEEGALVQDLAESSAESIETIVQENQKTFSEWGVDVAMSDLCAYELARLTVSSEGSSLDGLVTTSELQKYLPPERAMIVTESMKKLLFDDKTKALLQASLGNVVMCADSNGNRISEPASGKNICEGTSQAMEGDSFAATWPDIERYDGRWGGCKFQITRSSSFEEGGIRYGGAIENLSYCATLSSGTVAICTLTSCTYSHSVGGQSDVL